mmetsp:Transcript_24497/g.34051  ORF Transcript_24497/g.34051 Transcript_24497/m.34051 type:complete len:475 (+) Transcript_24497:108-1532(+)
MTRQSIGFLLLFATLSTPISAVVFQRERPTVSVVLPTSAKRHHFHPRIFRCFVYQTFDPVELIVIDDSGKPSPFFKSSKIATQESRLRYIQVNKGLTVSVGEKRNLGIQMASGEVIVTFDDDDLYSPRYIERMLEAMLLHKMDLVKLASWHWFNLQTGILARWEPLESECDAYIWGFGFSYVFNKTVWKQTGGYPDKMVMEDYSFCSNARHTGTFRMAAFETPRELPEAIVLHQIHGDNLSNVFSSLTIVKSRSEVGPLFAAQCAVLSGSSNRRAACRRFYANIATSIMAKETDFSKARQFPEKKYLSLSTCHQAASSWKSNIEDNNDDILLSIGAMKGLLAVNNNNRGESEIITTTPPKIPRILVFSSKENLLLSNQKDPNKKIANPWSKSEHLRNKRVVDNIIKLHPGWRVKFYTDKECRTLLESLKPPVEGILEVFNGVRRGAYKADICRLAALYTHGGVYMDVNMPARMG